MYAVPTEGVAGVEPDCGQARWSAGGWRYPLPTRLGIATPQSNRQPGLDWYDPSHPLGWLLAPLVIAETMIKASIRLTGALMVIGSELEQRSRRKWAR